MGQRTIREGKQSLREASAIDPPAGLEAFQAIFRLPGVGMAQCDPVTGRLCQVNPAFCELTGYSQVELQSRSFLDLTHPENCLRDVVGYEAMIEGSKPDWITETRYVRKEGAVIWVQVRGTAVSDRAGRASFGLILIYDLTRWKEADASLSRNRDLAERQLEDLEQFYTSAPVGLGVLDLSGRFLRVNDCLAEAHGLSPGAHVGATLNEVAPSLAFQREALFEQVLEDEEPLSAVEVQGRTPAQPGVIRTWLESWTPLRDPHGRIVAVNFATMEVTERLRVEPAAR